MELLISRLWPMLLAAGIAGLLFSALGGPGRGAPSSLRGVQAGALALLLSGAIVAWAGAVPGYVGLGLDIVVILAGGYAAGAVAGAVLRLAWTARGTAPSADPPVQPRSEESGSPS